MKSCKMWKLVLAILILSSTLIGCGRHISVDSPPLPESNTATENDEKAFQSIQAVHEYLSEYNQVVVDLSLDEFYCFVSYSQLEPCISIASVKKTGEQYYIANQAGKLGFSYDKGKPIPVAASCLMDGYELHFVWSPVALDENKYKTTDISNYQVAQLQDSYFYYNLTKSS
ncbi:MAG: hypothetical protein ACOYIE_00640 [Agathobaculum sp.]|jgi:hypothetical protein|uniref:hypothetical protein n=1 Tax=Agathobaculum sp. TaxID=2048138 RepID=UPI003D8C2FC1